MQKKETIQKPGNKNFSGNPMRLEATHARIKQATKYEKNTYPRQRTVEKSNRQTGPRCRGRFPAYLGIGEFHLLFYPERIYPGRPEPVPSISPSPWQGNHRQIVPNHPGSPYRVRQVSPFQCLAARH